MKITILDKDKDQKELRIEAEWSSIQPDYADQLTEFSKLPVPGFRPGKAPPGMVEKHYAKVLLDEVGTRCAQRFATKAVEQAGFTTTGLVSITDIHVKRKESLRFSVHFYVLPDFAAADFRSYRLTAATDEEQRNEISEWLLAHTRFETPTDLIKKELEFDEQADAKPGGPAWLAAAARVKLLLILRKIARQDGIAIDDQHVDKRIASMAETMAVNPVDLKKQLMQNGGWSRIAGFLLAEETLTYLLEVCQN